MDTAKDSRNGRIYAYYEFAKLPQDVRETIKPYLLCSSCNEKSTFVVEASDGSQAHFRIFRKHKHKTWCENQSRTFTSTEESASRVELEKIRSVLNKIDVKFENIGSSQANFSSNSTRDTKTKNGKTKNHHSIPSNQTKTSQKNLQQLLKFAMTVPSFLRDRSLVLKVESYSFTPKRHFVNFFELEDRLPNLREGKYYFFWGRIESVSDMKWLNVGSGKKASIGINDKIRTQLWEYLGVDSYWQIMEANVIVYGQLSFSKKNKPLVFVNTPNRIAFIGLKSAKPKKIRQPLTNSKEIAKPLETAKVIKPPIQKRVTTPPIEQSQPFPKVSTPPPKTTSEKINLETRPPTDQTHKATIKNPATTDNRAEKSQSETHKHFLSKFIRLLQQTLFFVNQKKNEK